MDRQVINGLEGDWCQELNRLEQEGNLRNIPSILHRGKYIARSQDPERWMLNLSGNDYLGLASDQELHNRFFHRQALQNEWRMSSSSSRLLTGNDPVYDLLEVDIAQSYQKSALLLNSGFHANIGILPAISDSKTLVLADKLVHASMVDGIRLSQAEVHRFRHNDLKHLRKLLDLHAKSHKRIILMTESIYSMDGDLAPILDYVELKKDYPQLLLYVDEAHAIGIRGDRGLGLCEELQCLDRIDLLVGTFGKALASMGAFVACSQTIKQILVNRMRSFIYSTHLPPIQAAWTQCMWTKMKSMQFQRRNLAFISEHLRTHLSNSISNPNPSKSHIVPYIIGDSAQAVRVADYLQSQGFFAMAVRPPTVPQGSSRIRFSLCADMNIKEVDQLIESIKTSESIFL